MGFSYGEHLDLRTGDPRRDDPAGARSWKSDRIISAKQIMALLVGQRPVEPENGESRPEPGTGTAPSIFLSGARITGQLDLRGIGFEPPLLLQQCALDEPLLISDSMSRSIRLYGCHLPGVTGDWLRCSGDVHLRDCRITGPVDLTGAYVAGQLVLSGSTLVNPGGVAVCGDGLVVAGDLYCRDGATVEGEFSLVAARIQGELRFTSSTLHNPGKVALRADRITIEKDLYCRDGFVAEGEVRLSDGQVKGQVNFNYATLRNPKQVALHADHLVVGSHLYCQDRFSAHGKISLVAARVGGEVRFSGATLSNPRQEALCADRLYVGADMYCRAGLHVEGMVSLRGAHIRGQLNFNHATLYHAGQVAMNADHLVVGSHLYCHDHFIAQGGISLVAARVGGEVRFSGSTLSNPGRDALCADRLVVGDDMYCRDHLVIDGAVSLVGAHVNGDLSFSTSTIRSPDRKAIRADQLTVGGDLACDEGFAVEGMVDLTDVHVGGELNFSNATIENPGRVALLAPRLIVEKDMFCREKFTAEGTVCLIGAHIGGKLSFTSAHLTGAHLTDQQLDDTGIKDLLMASLQPSTSIAGRKKWWSRRKPKAGQKPAENPPPKPVVSGVCGMALVADGLRVEIDLTCDGSFAACGEIRLKGARIKQNLDFSDATVQNQAGLAINAEDVQAERMLMPAQCPAGRISLRNGTMTELDDKRGVQPDQIDITGLAYDTLIPPMDPETRLEWLARNDYEPQPYDQLARSYRQLGYDEAARKVQLVQERRQREHLRPISKAWGHLQDVTIGYGYLPYRAAALFGLVLVVGMAGFWMYPLQPLSEPHPPFNPFFYTLDVLIPFADFGQRGLWNSTFGHEVFKVVLAICGWTLASTAVAGLTRALTRS